MPFDKNESFTSCSKKRGRRRAEVRLHARASGTKVETSVCTEEGTGRGVIVARRERRSAFFLRVYVAVVLPVVDPVLEVSEDRPFLLQPLLSLALLLFASCAAEAADTSFAKPSFPPLRSPRRKPPWITDPFHPSQRNISNILSPCIHPSMILHLGIG